MIIKYNLFPNNEIILIYTFLLILFFFFFFLPIKKPFFKRIKKYLFSLDHKKIGKLYIIIAILMLFRGFIDALLIKFQQILCLNHKGYLLENHFAQIFTAHGVIMIFFVAMPLLTGIMNVIIPKQIGSVDVAFPSLNLLSFWITFFSTMLINISLFLGEFAKIGWLGYPPLSELYFSPWVGVDYWDFSIQFSGISNILSSINFIVTIIKLRKKNIKFKNLPIFIWSCLCSNILILIAFPILSILMIEIYFDRHFFTKFYTSFFGGNQILYFNLIWAWGHPEVYILILPSFGIFSEVISNVCKKQIFSKLSLIYAIVLITILSFLVWLHHFFTMGAGPITNMFFSISTMIIAIPTGVKFYNWIFTFFFSNFIKNIYYYWILSFIIIFIIGGFSGIILSIPNLDYIFHNSMFLIAHFHSVILGGVVLGYLLGLNYWSTIIFNIKINNNLLFISIFFWFFGIILTFFPLYMLGYLGMMRRTSFYFNIFWNKILLVSFTGSIFILFAIISQIISFILKKNINNFDFENFEFLQTNKFIFKNFNYFYYKKIYIKNIYYIFKHKSNKLPFLISFFCFLNFISIIWKIKKYFILTFIYFFFLILIYFNE